MKFIQNRTAKAILDVRLERKFCCWDSEELRHGFIKDHQFGHHSELIKEDLNFKFCPFCGEEVRIINVWPTRKELEKVILELRRLCGYDE